MAVKHLDALVLWSENPEQAVTFYRAIGLALEDEQHDEGPVHYACELGPVHFAIYPAEQGGRAEARRAAGASLVGFQVDDVEQAVAAAQEVGAELLSAPEDMPWGKRALLQDPDGRTVELNQAQ